MMLTGGAADLFRLTTGLNVEAMAKLHPGSQKLYRNIPKTVGYQTVAEVVKSEACFAGIKVSDRLVFDPFLSRQKSTGNMCPKALLHVLLQINALWQTIME
jgi:hypothetical protein